MAQVCERTEWNMLNSQRSCVQLSKPRKLNQFQLTKRKQKQTQNNNIEIYSKHQLYMFVSDRQSYFVNHHWLPSPIYLFCHFDWMCGERASLQ